MSEFWDWDLWAIATSMRTALAGAGRGLCDSDARGSKRMRRSRQYRAARPKTTRDVKTYTDADRLLADPEVDVVDITLPTYLHAEYAIRALQAGKHVICEKPMATCSTDAKEDAAAAKKARRRLFVAECIRFWPAYATARDIIRSRKYGKVRSAVLTRSARLPRGVGRSGCTIRVRAARRRSICTSTMPTTFSMCSASRNPCSAAAVDPAEGIRAHRHHLRLRRIQLDYGRVRGSTPRRSSSR